MTDRELPNDTIPDDVPFYSEINLKYLRRSIEEGKRGQVKKIDLDELIKQFHMD